MLGWRMGRVGAIAGTVTRLPTVPDLFLSESLPASMKNQGNAPELLPCRRNGPTLGWRASRYLLCASLVMAFLVDTAWALDPHRLISQYAHSVWRVQDGFPHNPSSVTQTSDGYVWIAATGLVRFDGVRMVPVPPQKFFPTDVGINALLGSRDGSLWMATYQGLSRLKDGKAFSFPIKSGAVQGILEDHAGTIWITRSDTMVNPRCAKSLAMTSSVTAIRTMVIRQNLEPRLPRTNQETSGSDVRCCAAGAGVP